MADFDSTRYPTTRPVVIDPNVEAKPASEMASEGEEEGAPLGHRTANDGIDRERPANAGDDSLEAMRSAPLLPPG